MGALDTLDILSFMFFIPITTCSAEGTDSIMGTIILEFWCIYFAPVCILGYKYFERKRIHVKGI